VAPDFFAIDFLAAVAGQAPEPALGRAPGKKPFTAHGWGWVEMGADGGSAMNAMSAMSAMS